MDGETRRQKRRLNKAKFRRFLLTALCLYLVAMMAGVYVNQEKNKKIQEEDYEQLAAQLEEVRGENEAIERKISFAETDAYIERVARDQLGYVLPGEIKFVADDEGVSPAPEQEEIPPDEEDALREEPTPALDWQDGYLPGLPEGLEDGAP